MVCTPSNVPTLQVPNHWPCSRTTGTVQTTDRITWRNNGRTHHEVPSKGGEEMTTKNTHLKACKLRIKIAIKDLEAIKKLDIKSRKIAKASKKPKWTRSISRTSDAINWLKTALIETKGIRYRV